jgi:hypothetical protein
MTSHSGAIVGAGRTLPVSAVVVGLPGLFAVPPPFGEDSGADDCVDDGEVVDDDFALSDEATVVVEPPLAMFDVRSESSSLKFVSSVALSD